MSQATERPILFSGPMVRAILEGRKTVTRRPLKIQPGKHDHDWEPSYFDAGDNHWACTTCGDGIGPYGDSLYRCPYGLKGNRLWVRETFMDLRGTGVEHRPTPESPIQRYCYRTDVRPGSLADDTRKDMGLKCKPSIHMPRAASRILLEITDVRVERLQGINDEQCVAEGAGMTEHAVGVKLTKPQGESLPKAMFKDLWISINGPEAWESNPWVWVVEFKRIEP